MTWNKAAMQWANYRTPKPRVMHGPTLGQGPCRTELARTWQHDRTHTCCGYHVCHCPPKPSNAELCAVANARALLAEQAALEQHIQYLRRVKGWW